MQQRSIYPSGSDKTRGWRFLHVCAPSMVSCMCMPAKLSGLIVSTVAAVPHTLVTSGVVKRQSPVKIHRQGQRMHPWGSSLPCTYSWRRASFKHWNEWCDPFSFASVGWLTVQQSALLDTLPTHTFMTFLALPPRFNAIFLRVPAIIYILPATSTFPLPEGISLHFPHPRGVHSLLYLVSSLDEPLMECTWPLGLY